MRGRRDDRNAGPVPSRNAAWAPPRKRLLARLDRNSPITVIRAPQGFGKTELVTSWLEASRSDFRATLRLPEPEVGTDSETFWASVLDRIRAAGILVADAGPHGAVGAAEAVRESLARSGAPVLLVLTRIDLVDDGRIEEEILHLLDRCHNVNIVATACGRTAFGDPVLMEPTHELILARDLQYTLADAEELFEHADVRLAPGELEYILDRVGALPALMRVALVVAKSLPDARDRRTLLAHRLDAALDRFVQTTILEHPAVDEVREFVTTVAAARVITPDVARLLTGDPDAAAALAALELAGIVNRCETTLHEAWEFAPPIRERILALDERSGGETAQRLAVLARDAVQRGDVAAALSYAIEARRWELVVELVEDHWVELVERHFGLLCGTLRDLPTPLPGSRPALEAARDLILTRDVHPAALAPTLPGELSALESLGATEQARAAIGVGCAQSHLLRLAGEHDRAADATRRLAHLVRSALAHHPDEIVPQLPARRLQWGITYQLAGAYPESAVELRLAHRGALSQRTNFVARQAAGNSAMNWAVMGEPRRAQEWLELEDAHPDPDGRIEPGDKVGGLVARTLVALDRLDFATASRWLDELGEPRGRDELWPFVALAHGRYALATGQAYTGMAVLQRATAAQAGVLRPDTAVTRLLSALEVELRLALGEGNRALATLGTRAVEAPLLVVTAARAHLLTGTPAAALALCRTCDWFSHTFTRTQLEALLVETAAHDALGERAAAAQTWAHATALADRAGLLGTLATVPRKLLADLEATAPERSTAVTAFLASDVPEIFPAAVHHVELTERERAVLAELAQGLSTLEIARKLFVSTNTVKSQLRSLYRKIDAHSREEALQIAYRTGLID